MLHPGQPVIISDWQAETRLRLPLALREAGVASSVATVISIGRGERAYGFLGAHSREPRTFSDEDILFLETPSVSLHGPTLWRAAGCCFARS